MQNTSRHTALRELVAALARAQRALAAGHEDDARAALNHALEIDPGNVQARDLLLRLDAGSRSTGQAVSGGESTGRSWPPEAFDDGAEPVAAGQPATGWAAFEARVRARRAALESGGNARVRERHGPALKPPLTSWRPATRSISPPAIEERFPTPTPTAGPIATTEPPRVRADETPARLEAAVVAPASDEMVDAASLPPEIVARDAMTPATSGDPLADAGSTFLSSPHQIEDRQRSRRLAVPALLVAVAAIVAAAVGVWLIPPREEPVSVTSEEQAAGEVPTDAVGATPAEPPAAEAAPSIDTTDTATTSIADAAGEAPREQHEAVAAPSESARIEARASPVPAESRSQQLPPSDPGARDNVQPQRADAAASRESPPAPSSPSLPEPAAPVSTMAGHRPAESAGSPGGAIELAPSVPTATSPIASGTPSPSTQVPSPSAPAAPPRAAAAPATGPDPVMGIRRALDDYARAYSERDAVAASQVWPGVDARALARAFDQLSEQNVAFSKCDIRPEGGDRAQASCTGRATWVPKVGDRTPRAEARTWRFALTREGEEWVIEQVRF